MKMLFKDGVIVILAVLFLFSCSSQKMKLNPDYKGLLQRSNNEFIIDTNFTKAAAKDYVISGSTLQQQHKYAESILEFQNAMRYDTSAAIYYAMAKSYRELNKLDNATECLQKSLKIDSLFSPSMELMGQIYFMELRLDDAISVYNQLQVIKPSRENSLFLARLYELKDAGKAIKIYESLLGNGDEDLILNRLLNLYYESGNKDKYEETLEKIRVDNPNNVAISNNLMEAYDRDKKYEKAISLLNLNDTVLADYNKTLFFNVAGSIILDDTTKESDVMIKPFISKIGDHFRFDWKINLISGFLADRIGDSVACNKFLMHSLDIADSVADIPIQVSLFYINKKNYNESITILNKYKSDFPTDYRFPFYLGVAYTLNDNSRTAIPYLNEALAIDSSNIDIWTQIGHTYSELKMNDSSDFAYQRALQIDPSNALANNNYAYSLSERNIKLQDALKMINIALKSEPANPSYLDTYGWIMYQMGDYAAATEYIQKAIDTGGSSSEVWDHLGEIYVKTGENQKAREAFEKALKLDPQNTAIKNKLKKLE
jgi:tetratricopeptide (TPR) repeat protein